MVFLHYAMPYALADESQPFHFIEGQLYPTKGIFTAPTPEQPLWYFYIG